MSTDANIKNKPKSKVFTFECKVCQKNKPIKEMVVLTKYFPPNILCQDCEKLVD